MNFTKGRRITVTYKSFTVLMCVAISLCVLFANTTVAYAAGTNIFGNAEIPAQLETVYDIMIAIGLGAGAVSLTVCGVYMLIGGEKGMEFCRKWGSKVLVTVAALLIIPNILVGGYNLFNSVKWNPSDPSGNSPVEHKEADAWDIFFNTDPGSESDGEGGDGE